MHCLVLAPCPRLVRVCAAIFTQLSRRPERAPPGSHAPPDASKLGPWLPLCDPQQPAARAHRQRFCAANTCNFTSGRATYNVTLKPDSWARDARDWGGQRWLSAAPPALLADGRTQGWPLVCATGCARWLLDSECTGVSV